MAAPSRPKARPQPAPAAPEVICISSSSDEEVRLLRQPQQQRQRSAASLEVLELLSSSSSDESQASRQAAAAVAAAAGRGGRGRPAKHGKGRAEAAAPSKPPSQQQQQQQQGGQPLPAGAGQQPPAVHPPEAPCTSQPDPGFTVALSDATTCSSPARQDPNVAPLPAAGPSPAGQCSTGSPAEEQGEASGESAEPTPSPGTSDPDAPLQPHSAPQLPSGKASDPQAGTGSAQQAASQQAASQQARPGAGGTSSASRQRPQSAAAAGTDSKLASRLSQMFSKMRQQAMPSIPLLARQQQAQQQQQPQQQRRASGSGGKEERRLPLGSSRAVRLQQAATQDAAKQAQVKKLRLGSAGPSEPAATISAGAGAGLHKLDQRSGTPAAQVMLLSAGRAAKAAGQKGAAAAAVPTAGGMRPVEGAMAERQPSGIVQEGSSGASEQGQYRHPTSRSPSFEGSPMQVDAPPLCTAANHAAPAATRDGLAGKHPGNMAPPQPPGSGPSCPAPAELAPAGVLQQPRVSIKGTQAEAAGGQLPPAQLQVHVPELALGKRKLEQQEGEGAALTTKRSKQTDSAACIPGSTDAAVSQCPAAQQLHHHQHQQEPARPAFAQLGKPAPNITQLVQAVAARQPLHPWLGSWLGAGRSGNHHQQQHSSGESFRGAAGTVAPGGRALPGWLAFQAAARTPEFQACSGPEDLQQLLAGTAGPGAQRAGHGGPSGGGSASAAGSAPSSVVSAAAGVYVKLEPGTEAAAAAAAASSAAGEGLTRRSTRGAAAAAAAGPKAAQPMGFPEVFARLMSAGLALPKPTQQPLPAARLGQVLRLRPKILKHRVRTALLQERAQLAALAPALQAAQAAALSRQPKQKRGKKEGPAAAKQLGPSLLGRKAGPGRPAKVGGAYGATAAAAAMGAGPALGGAAAQEPAAHKPELKFKFKVRLGSGCAGNGALPGGAQPAEPQHAQQQQQQQRSFKFKVRLGSGSPRAAAQKEEPKQQQQTQQQQAQREGSRQPAKGAAAQVGAAGTEAGAQVERGARRPGRPAGSGGGKGAAIKGGGGGGGGGGGTSKQKRQKRSSPVKPRGGGAAAGAKRGGQRGGSGKTASLKALSKRTDIHGWHPAVPRLSWNT